MSEPGPTDALVPLPLQSPKLVRSGTAVLAKRGLSDLFLAESAEESFQRAMKFYDARSYDEYFECLKRAVDLNSNHIHALVWLGFSYESGIGVALNLSQAEIWFRLAAEQGDDEAQVNLAWKYWGGEFGQRDYGQAVEWFHRAAEQGNLEAQYRLGEMYYKGEGVRQDLLEAKKWFHKLADRGNSNAQVYLNRILEDEKS